MTSKAKAAPNGNNEKVLSNNGASSTAVPSANETRRVANALLMAANSILVERYQSARRIGKQFNGERDLYEVLGYPRTLQFQDFDELYDRDGLAYRIVSFPAKESWKNAPKVKDGPKDTGLDDTPFVEAFEELARSKRIWHYLSRLDELAGIGRYGVLLIGLPKPKTDGIGNDWMLQPAKSADVGSLGLAGLLFLRPLTEGCAMVTELSTDPSTDQYGRPKSYRLEIVDESLAAGASMSVQLSVDASRVIHVAENLKTSEIWGRSRLQVVYNYLQDMLKVAGGTPEIFWQMSDRGMHVNIDPEYTLTDEDEAALDEEFDDYKHNLSRFIKTQGATVNELGSQEVDPTGVFEMLIAVICASISVPIRKFIGSERGELASSQDERNWAGVVSARQNNFCEPQILRPFIDRLIKLNILPAPTSGEYSISWPSIYQPSDTEKVDMAQKMAGTAAVMSPQMPERVIGINEIRAMWGLPEIDPDELMQMLQDIEQLDMGTDIPPATMPEATPQEPGQMDTPSSDSSTTPTQQRRGRNGTNPAS